jgi:hypothetical protein
MKSKAISLELNQFQIPLAEKYITDFIKDEDVISCIPMTLIKENNQTSCKLVFIVKVSNEDSKSTK